MLLIIIPIVALLLAVYLYEKYQENDSERESQMSPPHPYCDVNDPVQFYITQQNKYYNNFEKTRPYYKQEQVYIRTRYLDLENAERVARVEDGISKAEFYRGKQSVENIVNEKHKFFYIEAERKGISTSDVIDGTNKFKDFLRDMNLTDTYEECSEMYLKGQEEQNNALASVLYSKCRDAGISRITSAADKESIKLLIENEKLKIEESKIFDMFYIGKTNIENAEKAKREQEKKKRIDIQRIKDCQKEKELQIYIDLYGREKTIQMCKDKAIEYRKQEAELRKSIEDLNKSANNLYNMSKERESSWGLHGGIASAIAGPVAGAMAASEIQRNNAAKNARNAQLGTSLAMFTLDAERRIREEIDSAVASAKTWEKRAAKAPNLLMQEFPAEKLLAHLDPQVYSLKVLETGSIEIEVKTLRSELLIFDTVNAVVDGTFLAVFYKKELQAGKEEQKIGEAFFTLPYNGSNNGTILSSICCASNEKIPEQRLTVRFKPHRLWAIEKLKI